MLPWEIYSLTFNPAFCGTVRDKTFCGWEIDLHDSVNYANTVIWIENFQRKEKTEDKGDFTFNNLVKLLPSKNNYWEVQWLHFCSGGRDEALSVNRPPTYNFKYNLHVISTTRTAGLNAYQVMCFRVRLNHRNVWWILAPYALRYFTKCENACLLDSRIR